MYQLIIFDWDGTLMDSADKIANCIIASAVQLGIKEPTKEHAKSIIGLSLHEAMRILFPNENELAINKLVENYKYHFVTADDTSQGLFAGVEQGLAALSDAGALLAVATGKARRGLKRVFDEVGIEHYFVVSRCADETRSKPHPQMLHEILDFTAIGPHNTIMIGDTTFDMDMASNANMHGLAAGYGVHSSKALTDAKAITVIDSFSEIIDWLLDGRIKRAYSGSVE